MRLMQSIWKPGKYHASIHMNKTLYEALTVEEDHHIEKIMDVLREYLYRMSQKYECSHEWHADKDNDCNVCIKCGARQEIYTE